MGKKEINPIVTFAQEKDLIINDSCLKLLNLKNYKKILSALNEEGKIFICTDDILKYLPKNFEEMVTENKTIKTKKKGLFVQSIGEQKIADFLYDNDIDFNYDKQLTLAFNEPNKKGHNQEWIRPDFYLTEFATIIEYWGMKGDPDYDDKKDWKERIYAESKTKYISIYKEDLPDLEGKLEKKLKRLGVNV